MKCKKNSSTNALLCSSKNSVDKDVNDVTKLDGDMLNDDVETHQHRVKKKKKKRKQRDETMTNNVEHIDTNKMTVKKKKMKMKKETLKTKKKTKKTKTKDKTSDVDNTQTKSLNSKKSNTNTCMANNAVRVSRVHSSFSKSEANAYCKKHQMCISEQDKAFRPLRAFSETGLCNELMQCCASFECPTPIQSQCWPVVLSGRDCISIAQTGSGKTLGFGVPLLAQILDQMTSSNNKITHHPLGLVIAPTRELALQSYEVICEAGNNCSISSVCIFGGADRRSQVSALKAGVHVIIATPGRLLALVDEGCVSLKHVRFVVLDEADRMLDMGFVPDIRRLIACVSSQHQTMMFSATWPPEIQSVAAEFLQRPIRITIGSDELSGNENVQQSVEVLKPFDRDNRLHVLLQELHDRKNRVLVFVLYKKEAVRVEHMLRRKGWHCTAIHGDKAQSERFEALKAFRSGSTPLLIATDVAARGLDIPNVEVVLNYSFPLTIEDYIHRIGRTGRAGKSGRAHTLFTELDKTLAGALVNVLNEGKAKVPSALIAFGTSVKRKQHSMYGDHVPRGDRVIKETVHVKF